MALPVMSLLDAAPRAEFLDTVSPLFEQAPRFLDRLADARPYGSWAELFRESLSIALAAPREVQLELLDAHPRIGAPPASVSEMSFREQGYDQEQVDAIAALEPLNEAYEQRLGFRYVVYVAGRPRSAIVPLLRDALEADPDSERERGLADVIAIARARATGIGLAEEPSRLLVDESIGDQEDDG